MLSKKNNKKNKRDFNSQQKHLRANQHNMYQIIFVEAEIV